MVECISIFSGAGGLDAGAQQAGARIVAAIEIDHDSTETLRQNGLSLAHNVLETDIREVDFTHEGRSTDKLREAFADNPHVRFPMVYWEATTRRVNVSGPTL